MMKNQLIIAAAGSGKTTYLVRKALDIKNQNVLITTYTEANEEEIIKAIYREAKGFIPKNITVQTWFSFLLQHGVRPHQSVLSDDLHISKIGFYLTENQSGHRYTYKGKPVYWGEKDFDKYYFTKNQQIYSDKISKFIFEVNRKTDGALLNRISRIFPNIFIDEIQDLAGWELEILKLLFYTDSKIILVGDPRQVVYLTHHSAKYKNYRDGKIKDFIEEQCKNGLCEIDEKTMNVSHRNNYSICSFSSALFPEYTSCEPCTCIKCRNYTNYHEGVFLVDKSDVGDYIKKYKPTILRYNNSAFPEWNFGKSKGMSFNRVLIYPTEKISSYLKTGNLNEINTIRSKFYVALTRARYSAAIVDNCNESDYIKGITKYISE